MSRTLRKVISDWTRLLSDLFALRTEWGPCGRLVAIGRQSPTCSSSALLTSKPPFSLRTKKRWFGVAQISRSFRSLIRSMVGGPRTFMTFATFFSVSLSFDSNLYNRSSVGEYVLTPYGRWGSLFYYIV